MESNCIGKAAMSYVMGGAMGLIMAMFMNAVEMREIEVGKVRRSTTIVLRKDWRRILSTGKGFASFGGFFVLFECMIEHVFMYLSRSEPKTTASIPSCPEPQLR